MLDSLSPNDPTGTADTTEDAAESQPQDNVVTENVTQDEVIPALAPGGESEVSMPTADPDLMSQVRVENTTTAPTAGEPIKGETDKEGFAFDPSMHMTNADGSPKLSVKTGYICRKRGGAATKAQSVSGVKSRVNPKIGSGSAPSGAEALGASTASIASPNAPSVETETRIKATAKAATHMTNILSCLVYGAEDGAMKTDRKSGVDEPAMWEVAYADYMRAKGVVDIPPAMALAMCAVAHVSARINTEGHKTRVRTIKEKFVDWWARRKANKVKKAMAKAEAENG